MTRFSLGAPSRRFHQRQNGGTCSARTKRNITCGERNASRSENAIHSLKQSSVTQRCLTEREWNLLRWVRAQPQLKAVSFCLFTELEEDVRGQLGVELVGTVCLF